MSNLPAPLRHPGLEAVLNALDAKQDKIRLAGGCVRDWVMGRAIADVDLATVLHPSAVTARLREAGLKAIPTGLDHGTVTAVVVGKTYEITTLRRDLETDGRHAVVAFSQDWAEDAQRRDLTMNALFMDAQGNVHDTVGGVDDAKAGLVRFVGDPDQRVAEDILRILRFFRFFASHGRAAPDTAGLQACRGAAHRIPELSAERIAKELLRLLEAPGAMNSLPLMAETGVLAHALPESDSAGLERLARLMTLETPSDAVLRLAVLVCQGQREAAAARLKLSRADQDRLAALDQPLPSSFPQGHALRVALHRYGSATMRDRVLTAAPSALPETLAAIEGWEPKPLPVHGRDVLTAGVPPGPAVGDILAKLEAWWEERDFQATRDEALAVMATLCRAAGSSE